MLSSSSEYAIRALTFLALQPEGGYHLAREIAERVGLPAPFLGKVLQPLVARGVLTSLRGRSGGFRLARPASQVTLLQIVDTQERLGKAHECLLGQSKNGDHQACPLHEYWKSTTDTFLERLSQTTLNDMAEFSRAHPGSGYPIPVVSGTQDPPPTEHRAEQG